MASSALGPAAEALHAGFLAAQEQDRRPLEINVLRAGEAQQELLEAYRAASASADLIVGPLTRSAVALIARDAVVDKLTLTLAAPEWEAEPAALPQPALPARLLVLGLSIEDEARQIADWAQADYGMARAWVVTTSTSWQRRAAHAFLAQWRQHGRQGKLVELPAREGRLLPASLQSLQEQLEHQDQALIFSALDVWQTTELRDVIGDQVPLYGTSQLNPVALPDRFLAEPNGALNGVRLLDLPWQILPDHPAVMRYPRAVVPANTLRNADFERLYALGIDAYRVARELAAGRRRFELDGVTGQLTVDVADDAAHCTRVLPAARYRSGEVHVEQGLQ